MLCNYLKRHSFRLKVPAERIQDVVVLVLQKVLVPGGAFIKLFPYHELIAAQLIFIWFQIRVNICGQSEIKESIESQ